MSNYGNNQQQYYQQSHPHRTSYTIANTGQPHHPQQQQQQHPPDRRSSFDNGDDSAMFPGNGQSQYYGSYGQSPPLSQSQYMQTSSNLPYRSASQLQSHGSLGGYQHQSQPTVPAHSSYNPASYQTQNTYNPQSYGSPQPNSYGAAGHQSSYQPYVPAAYGDQTVNRTASVYNSGHYATSPQHSAYGSPQPPALPARPYAGHAQSPPQSYSQNASQSYSSYQSGQYLAMPSPPAPAPPPHQDSLAPARPYSHSTTSYDHYDESYNQYLSSQSSSDVHRNHSSASRASNQYYSSSPQLSSGGVPSRNPSGGGMGSGTYGRHPQGSTLPGLPSESESDNERRPSNASHGQSAGYDDLMSSLDAAIGTSSTHGAFHVDINRDPLFAPASPQLALSPDERPTHNGVISTGETNINYGAFANDSDAEAAAGLAAMQAADEQEAAEEARRRSSHASGTIRYSDRERSDDSDYAHYGDLSLAGGGYAGTMHYGDELPAVTTTTPYGHDEQQLNPRMSSQRSSNISSQSNTYDVSADLAQSFPTLHPDAVRVDAGGTGGLTEPSSHSRRLSYEDQDEGSDYADGGDGIPDLFFHPGMSPNRPLPPPPARSGSDSGPRPTSQQHLSAGPPPLPHRYSSYDAQPPRLYPGTPDNHSHDALSPNMVPRSTSLASTRSQPRPEQPARSKTDADRAKFLKAQAAGRPLSEHLENGTPTTDVEVGALDLPTIPRKKFDPAKISSDTFKKCIEPWAISCIYRWLRELTDEETDLKEATLAEAIAALFCHKVPTMSSIEADELAQIFIQQLYTAQALLKEEEWVKFSSGESAVSGVIYQLTGLGCYSSRIHQGPNIKGKCYSYLCMRTVKKAEYSGSEIDGVKEVDWQPYWKLDKERALARGQKEAARQSNLRELVYGEEGYLAGLRLVRRLYYDGLAGSESNVMPVKRLKTYLTDVFAITEACRKVNEDFLVPQLKYREKEQGPFVSGYSDIYREWIRRARSIYVEYAGKYPKADQMIRDEMKRNPAFTAFLETNRSKAGTRLGWDHYLKSPIQRMQRLILGLETMLKNTESIDEKTGLQFAVDEIKAAAHEMDLRVDEVNKAVELIAYKNKLKLHRTNGDDLDLALDHLGRSIVMRGDMMRQGGKGISWVACHAVLFDHYLVLAKPQKDVYGNEIYDVSKPPIPMGLISLESTNDGAVQKSTVRGVTTISGNAPTRGADPRLGRTTTNQSGGLQHTNTGITQSSGGSGSGIVTTSTTLEDKNEDRIYYPFKVKHLGRTEVYTLYASTADRRQEWCEAILSAKTQHAEALHAQNAEPFKLRVLADTAFGVETYAYASRRIPIRGTPIDRAIREVDKRYAGAGRPAPVSRAAVNCATVFQQPGRTMCAVGTDAGVYFSEYNNPRGWIHAIQTSRVSQIAVLEEFNLLILLADKVLIAYHLDVVCPPSGPPVPQADSSVRKAPQRLSGNKDVSFFLAGKMRDRMLVFYQKKDGINSIFKILEPVLQKSATSKSRWLGNSGRRGQTEFFRDYDEFYIPAETYGLNAFHSSLAVATKRGMEVLTLDKKFPWGVPNLESEDEDTQRRLSSIASRLKDLRPLGMFRLSDTEFLVAFSECAVYVNKLGDISRSVIMEFVGRANTAALYYPYLILFNDDFVEIRDAQNGRMKQVIAGQTIRMLDDGGNHGRVTQSNGAAGQSAPRTVKLSMQHPEHEKCYVVVEMLMRTEEQ